MLLIIEDKDDPTGQIAAEVDDANAAELAYIPVITVQIGYDIPQARLKSAVDRMSFEYRKSQPEEPVNPQQSEKLLPVYLRALSHIGKRPAYISPSALQCFENDPAEDGAKLCTRG